MLCTTTATTTTLTNQDGLPALHALMVRTIPRLNATLESEGCFVSGPSISAYVLHQLEKAQHIHNVFNDSSKDSFLPLRIPLRIPPTQGIGHCGTGHIQNARYWALWHGKRAAF